jgi:hypothetical protein
VPEEKSPHTSAECLARAMQCERLAEQTTFAPNKATLLDIAKRWRALAAEREQPSARLKGRTMGSPSLK